jgi:D-cysteine desulfhydrase
MRAMQVVPTDRTRPRLFDALPALADAVPWRPLVHTPTPVERASAIAGWLGRDDVWMKRDDLASPLYGGNKVRRYEFVLAEVVARGARRIVTAGGLASTQVTATAVFGQELGLAVRAVLFDQPITKYAKKALLMDVSTGAELIWGGGYLTTVLRTLGTLLRDRRAGNFFIMPGASNPIANLGYVDAALELAAQVEGGEMPRPDAIVLPTGSAGTLAALALGMSWLGWDTEIIGVRIAPRLLCNRFTIGNVVRATDRFLRVREPKRWRISRPARWSLHHGAIGAGYGHATAEAIEAIDHVGALTGESGEVTYSAKAMVGLRAIAQEPRWMGKTLLLWNTLSTPRPPIAPDAPERIPQRLKWVLEAPEVA